MMATGLSLFCLTKHLIKKMNKVLGAFMRSMLKGRAAGGTEGQQNAWTNEEVRAHWRIADVKNRTASSTFAKLPEMGC